MFKDTLKCQAMFYLDDSNMELTRDAFLEELFRGNQKAYMLYIGPGFVPLQVAVIAWDGSDAISAFEDWALNTDRQAELEENENGEYTYLLTIEEIPAPVLIMPAELKELKK